MNHNNHMQWKHMLENTFYCSSKFSLLHNMQCTKLFMVQTSFKLKTIWHCKDELISTTPPTTMYGILIFSEILNTQFTLTVETRKKKKKNSIYGVLMFLLHLPQRERMHVSTSSLKLKISHWITSIQTRQA